MQNDIDNVKLRRKMTFRQVNRVFEEPETSYFLFEPRGTGKSTLAAQRHPDALLMERLHFQNDYFPAGMGIYGLNTFSCKSAMDL